MIVCWRKLLLGFMMLFTLLFAGCGGGSGSTGGAGVISSSGSLALAVDKTTVAAGTDSITATVTLTSLLSQPVNGVSVTVDVTYNGIVLASTSGNTNTNGIAVIALPVAMVSSDRVYYLQARSNGVTSSSTVAVTIKAPVLSTTIPTTTSGSAVTGSTITYVLQGDTVSLKDGSGNPIAGSTIVFTLDSQTGSSTGVLLRNGTAINTTTNNTFSVVTDATGMANTGITARLTAGAEGTDTVATFYYTLSAVASGQTFTKQNSSQFTLTATAAPSPASLTLTPSTLTFAATDPVGTAKIVTVAGGTSPYTVASGSADIGATVSGNAITVTNNVTGAGTSQSVVTVRDSSGLASNIVVTYAK